MRDQLKSLAIRYWVAIFAVSYCVKWFYLFHTVDFSSSYPIVNNDYIQYYARVMRMMEFLKSGHFWGYDPFEMAGYPAVLREIGSYFLGVIGVIAYATSGFLSIKTSVLVTVIAGHVLVPLLIVLSIRNFGGSLKSACVGFALLTIMYGGLEILSVAVIPQGILGFTLGCFVAIWQTSLFRLWVTRPTRWAFLLFVLASVALPQIHPSAVLLSFVPLLILYVTHARTLSLRDHALLVVTGSLVIWANAYWIRPYVIFSDWMDVLKYWESNWRVCVQLLFPIQSTWQLLIRALVHLTLLSTAVFLLIRYWRTSVIRFALFSGWLGWLFVLIVFGSQITFISALQPFRFVLGFWLVIILVSALAVDHIVWSRRKIGCVALFLIVGVVGGWRETVVTTSRDVPTFSTRLENSQERFLRYVCDVFPGQGRLLVECGYRHRPNIADLCAVMSKKPLLGGHDPGNFLKGRFTMFGGLDTTIPSKILLKEHPSAFGRPLIEFLSDEAEFSDYLRLYNVSHIAAWSLPTVRILNRFDTTLRHDGKQGEYTMYAVVASTFSWFDQGSGDLKMDYNELTIENASSGTLVLKFHWIKTLSCDPPLPIRGVYRKEDPIPFIEIDNTAAVKRIRVHNFVTKS